METKDKGAERYGRASTTQASKPINKRPTSSPTSSQKQQLWNTKQHSQDSLIVYSKRREQGMLLRVTSEFRLSDHRKALNK